MELAKRALQSVLLALLLCSLAQAEKESMGPFGEKILLRVGGMYVNQDTRIRVDGDSGLGVQVDFEDFFDLEEELNGVLQFTVEGRFAERHRIGLMYYNLDRSAESVLERDWDGDDLQVSAGATADTKLGISIYDLSYGYAFIQDEKHRLEGTIGLFWASLDVSLDFRGEILVEGEPSSGGEVEATSSLNAPLPVFGLSYDYAIKPRWLVGVDFKYFTLRTNVIHGSIVQVSADTRYYFWDHFEVGGGITLFDTSMSIDTGSFKGGVDWSFWGPQLFLGARF